MKEEVENIDPREALKNAITKHNIAEAARLIDQDPSLVHQRAVDGFLPLYRAIHSTAKGKHNLEMIKLLCESNAADLPSNTDQWALMKAVASGREDIVYYLLSEVDFNPHIKDAKGISALHMAAHIGHKPLVDLLLEFGVKDSLDSTGKSAAQIAAKNGYKQLSEYIAEYYPEPEQFAPLSQVKPQNIVKSKFKDSKNSASKLIAKLLTTKTQSAKDKTHHRPPANWRGNFLWPLPKIM